MKLLLDENLPKRLRQDFTEEGFRTYSVQEMGWSGKKNGELLELLVDNQPLPLKEIRMPIAANPA